MTDRITPLNHSQIESIKELYDFKNSKPARIMCERKSVNLITGYLIGGNVMYQIFYWDRPKEFFKRAKKMLEESNPGKVFRIDYS